MKKILLRVTSLVSGVLRWAWHKLAIVAEQERPILPTPVAAPPQTPPLPTGSTALKPIVEPRVLSHAELMAVAPTEPPANPKPAKRSGQPARNLEFIYTNEKGETGVREVSNLRELPHHIEGFCHVAGAVRTFRKDRIVEYLNASESLLNRPFDAPASQPRHTTKTHTQPQILFTGFTSLQRGILEEMAQNHGLEVAKSVTVRLVFLCCGPNAGPAKIDKARSQGVYIVDEVQFKWLLETGELPDESLPHH